jgi:hypothetical protein
MVVRPATALIGWTLRRTGFAGVTLPWGIYILPERLQDERLVRHEQEHARQIDELGVIKFYALYFWYLLRFGYTSAHPLEKEARDAERRSDAGP